MFDEILQWFSSHLSNLTDALVYCAIAGVTLIGVFKCLIPLITTTHALRRAITRLQQDAGTRAGHTRLAGKTLYGQSAEELLAALPAKRRAA